VIDSERAASGVAPEPPRATRSQPEPKIHKYKNTNNEQIKKIQKYKLENTNKKTEKIQKNTK